MTGVRDPVLAGKLANGVAAVGLTLLCAAYTIGRKGMEVTKGKRVTGWPAWIIAGVIAAIGLGIGVGGVLYVPSVLGPR